VTDRLTITSNPAFGPAGQFALHNCAGQVVDRFRPGGRTSVFDYDIGRHPAGIYLLQYQEGGTVLWSQKVIKE
jgi:hypothetical protein